MQTGFLHVTENIQSDALGYYLPQLQPPSQIYSLFSIPGPKILGKGFIGFAWSGIQLWSNQLQGRGGVMNDEYGAVRGNLVDGEGAACGKGADNT